MARQAVKYGAIAAAAAAIIIIIIAAAAFAAPAAVPENPGPRTTLRVAVVTDALFSDEGWGESALNAARFIESRYGFEVATEDNVPIADIEQTLNRYAEGHDLVIAHGVQWGDQALRVGNQYPEVEIVIFTGLAGSGNVASIFPQQQEGSFLLGALAGMMTESGVIGYVGGEEYPNVVNVFEGYRQGAVAVNPDVRIIGTYLNDWDNPAKGREAATSIIRQGADVIFHVADSSGHGVIESASENGVYALGAVQDQNSLAPGTVLSSFVLDVDKAYGQAVDAALAGELEGKVYRPGLEAEKGAAGDGVVYMAPFHGLDGRVPADVKARLQELAEDLLAGDLAVPERLEASA